MKPVLLCANIPPDRMMRLSLLSSSLGIQVKCVPEKDWGQPIGALCGVKAPVKNPPKAALGGEIMVMAHFPDALIDSLLGEIRKNGLKPIRCKAVLTRHNQDWSLGQLYPALSREAALMEAAGKGIK